MRVFILLVFLLSSEFLRPQQPLWNVGLEPGIRLMSPVSNGISLGADIFLKYQRFEAYGGYNSAGVGFWDIGYNPIGFQVGTRYSFMYHRQRSHAFSELIYWRRREIWTVGTPPLNWNEDISTLYGLDDTYYVRNSVIGATAGYELVLFRFISLTAAAGVNVLFRDLRPTPNGQNYWDLKPEKETLVGWSLRFGVRCYFRKEFLKKDRSRERNLFIVSPDFELISRHKHPHVKEEMPSKGNIVY